MCEDFPCCGHENGCCPDFDEKGNQINMKCICGVPLPLNSRYSICHWCMIEGNPDDYPNDDWDDDEDDYPEDDCPEDDNEWEY